jgi:hypothetical protein
MLVQFLIFGETSAGALKIRAKVRGSRPFCWYFCWYPKEQTFTANSAIPNEGIEQIARKNHGASAKPNTSTGRAPVMGLRA